MQYKRHIFSHNSKALAGLYIKQCQFVSTPICCFLSLCLEPPPQPPTFANTSDAPPVRMRPLCCSPQYVHDTQQKPSANQTDLHWTTNNTARLTVTESEAIFQATRHFKRCVYATKAPVANMMIEVIAAMRMIATTTLSTTVRK